MIRKQTFDEVKEAVRKAGYGRIVFLLSITETGSSESTEVIHPAELVKSEPVRAAILKLRFCPAVRYSQYAAVTMKFDLTVDGSTRAAR